jgi:curved DNA-binding protein CbpA
MNQSKIATLWKQMFQDYYKILGITANATHEDIKKAYWSKAKIYHPDVNNAKNASQLFALISEAYEVLSDANKRLKFDSNYTKRESFHYDWKSYQQVPRRKRSHTKDMRESHPVLFNLLFLFGMFVGFILTILSIAGTYLRLWPGIFIVIAIPGIILIIEGFNGIIGRETHYEKLFSRLLKRNKKRFGK